MLRYLNRVAYASKASRHELNVAAPMVMVKLRVKLILLEAVAPKHKSEDLGRVGKLFAWVQCKHVAANLNTTLIGG